MSYPKPNPHYATERAAESRAQSLEEIKISALELNRYLREVGVTPYKRVALFARLRESTPQFVDAEDLPGILDDTLEGRLRVEVLGIKPGWMTDAFLLPDDRRYVGVVVDGKYYAIRAKKSIKIWSDCNEE